jgi:integrase
MRLERLTIEVKFARGDAGLISGYASLFGRPADHVDDVVMSGAYRATLDQATRDDYRPIMDFSNVSGLRLKECILRWSEVDWDAKLIVKLGKGGQRITVPITSVIREILWPLRGQHDEFVFTYVAMRTKGKRVKGSRYPITYNGLKTQWKRSRRRSGVKDFRFHDKRHDFATKLLRDTGNLKLVQKALNHAKIETTLKYAHVLQDEVSAAVERVQKSRTKSRSAVRKVS